MKNIVFIPYIKRENDITKSSSIGHANRHSGYEYGIKSWKNWCDKNHCELYIMSDLLLPESEMLITWQRWQVLNILEHNEVDYDQVLVVDADSIVHPDCPNFFEMTDNKFTSVLTDGDYEWVNRAINGYSKLFFNKEFCIPSFEFFMTGFVIINKTHKKFFDEVFKWYDKNKKEITRKHLLYLGEQCWWKDDLTNLYNSGWVYQFNAMVKNQLGRDRTYWMKRIYEELYEQ